MSAPNPMFRVPGEESSLPRGPSQPGPGTVALHLLLWHSQCSSQLLYQQTQIPLWAPAHFQFYIYESSWIMPLWSSCFRLPAHLGYGLLGLANPLSFPLPPVSKPQTMTAPLFPRLSSHPQVGTEVMTHSQQFSQAQQQSKSQNTVA